MEKKRVLVMQHAEAEHLGAIAEALVAEEVECSCIRGDLGESVPETIDGFQGLILMGGPQGVYEEARFPFIRAEKLLTQQAINRDLPVLGVCLGSQILAEVLGSTVRPSGSFEVGWRDVALTNECANDPVLSPLPRSIVPLHWHGDIYDLPPGAKSIGSSEMTPVQGFVVKERFYGLLFHLETTMDQLMTMIEGFPDDLRRGGMTAEILIKQAPDRMAALRDPRSQVFRRWAALVGRATLGVSRGAVSSGDLDFLGSTYTCMA
jgi:GMP synthase (glutamine-hydrolysing)